MVLVALVGQEVAEVRLGDEAEHKECDSPWKFLITFSCGLNSNDC